MTERIQIKGGFYFRSVELKKNMKIPQHTHDHDHATYIGYGKVDLLIDGVYSATYETGDAVEIKGGKEHEFVTVEDSLLACIWPVSIGETFDIPQDQGT